jgi:predicted dehydrogenase
VNIALIGYGFMGRAHSNAFLQAPHFFETGIRPRLKVVCGRNAAAVELMAARWGWEETATDWRAVIDRPDIDAVDIAVPNYLHAEIAIAAAQAGKMVFCEKPLATTLEDAERMADAARKVRTLVWFNYRRVPAIAFTRQLIDRGRIGRVFHYRAVYLQSWGNDPARRSGWKLTRAEAGSGVIGDLLSHLVDTAHFLNGPIAEIRAETRIFLEGREVEDAVAAIATFENGSFGTFEATRFATGVLNRNGFEIHGENGMAGFDFEDMNRLRFFDAALPKDEQGIRSFLVTGPGHPYWQNFWKPGHTIGYEHTFIATFGDFLQSLEAGTEFHANFEDAVAVQRVLDRVERSA